MWETQQQIIFYVFRAAFFCVSADRDWGEGGRDVYISICVCVCVCGIPEPHLC